MHLGFYVRHHTLDDNGEVGGLTLLLPSDQNHQAYILDKLNILPIGSG